MELMIKLIRGRLRLAALTVGVSVLSVGISLWWNAQIAVFINAVNGAQLIASREVGTAIGTIFLSAGAAYALGVCSSWTLETIAHDLRMGYARHFSALPLSEIENLNAGEQVSKLQNEISDVMNFLGSNLFSIIDDIIRFVGTFSWLLWLNPRLTVLANAPVVLLVGYTVFSSKIIGKAANDSQQANARMTGVADTLITVFPILRLFDAAAMMKHQYKASLDAWQAASIREERRCAGLMSLSAMMSYLPMVMLFLIGGAQVIEGTETIGTIYVFINLSGNVSGVMMNMPRRIAAFRRFAANMNRLESSVEMGNERAFI